MILVDTSVWVDHLRQGNSDLASLLGQNRVVMHPFIIGELACGNLTRRAELLGLLNRLPRAPLASHDEVLHMVEGKHLYGCGIGWIDAHLLASALMASAGIWTLDVSLQKVAASMGLAAE